MSGRAAIAAAAIAALASGGAGCTGTETPNDSDGDPPAYDVAFPPGFKPASETRVDALQKSVESGIDRVDGEVGEVVVEDLYVGFVDGSPVEIDVQTEDTADGVDVARYDELSRDALDSFPNLEISDSSDYVDFDGDESTVVDIGEGANGPTSRIATAIHGGFAYNVTLFGPTQVVTGPGDQALRTMIESWRWQG